MSRDERAKLGLWEAAKRLAAAFTVIGTLAGALFGLNAYIDSRIRKHLADPETLGSIATQLRPALVFDSRGRILADLGGSSYIENIEVLPGDGSLPTEIIVSPTSFLAVAPLLESLNEPGLTIEPERGQGIAWRYEISSGAVFDAGAQNPQFRLEILRL